MQASLFWEVVRRNDLQDAFAQLEKDLQQGDIDIEEYQRKLWSLFKDLQIPTELEEAVLKESDCLSETETASLDSNCLVQTEAKDRQKTLIIGNGDILSLAQGLSLANQYGLDGFMVGRGIFQDIWLFNPLVQKARLLGWQPTVKDRLEVLFLHLLLWLQTWGIVNCKNLEELKDLEARLQAEIVHFPLNQTDLEVEFYSNLKTKKMDILKKYFKIYLSGFEGASQLRANLMACRTLKEVYEQLQSFKVSLSS